MKDKYLPILLSLIVSSAHAGIFDDLKKGIDKAGESVNDIKGMVNKTADLAKNASLTKQENKPSPSIEPIGTVQGVVGNAPDINSLYRNAKVLAPSLGLKSETPLMFPLRGYSADGKPVGCNTMVKDTNHSQAEVERFIKQHKGERLQLTKANKISTSGYCTFGSYSVVSPKKVTTESQNTTTLATNQPQSSSVSTSGQTIMLERLLPRSSTHKFTVDALKKGFNISQSHYPLYIQSPAVITVEGRNCGGFISDKYKTHKETEDFYSAHEGKPIKLLGVRQGSRSGICLFDTAVQGEPKQVVSSQKNDKAFIGDIIVKARNVRPPILALEQPLNRYGMECSKVEVSHKAKEKIERMPVKTQDFMTVTLHGVTLKPHTCYAENIAFSKEAKQFTDDAYSHLSGFKAIVIKQIAKKGYEISPPYYGRNGQSCESIYWAEPVTQDEREIQNLVKSKYITGKEVVVFGLRGIDCKFRTVAVKGDPSTYP